MLWAVILFMVIPDAQLRMAPSLAPAMVMDQIFTRSEAECLEAVNSINKQVMLAQGRSMVCVRIK